MPNGHCELGSDIKAAMVKSVGTMVTKLPDTAIYAKFKAWLSAVEDWVASYLGTALEALRPHAVQTVAWLTMMPELYTVLETMGALGMQKGGGRGVLRHVSWWWSRCGTTCSAMSSISPWGWLRCARARPATLHGSLSATLEMQR